MKIKQRILCTIGLHLQPLDRVQPVAERLTVMTCPACEKIVRILDRHDNRTYRSFLQFRRIHPLLFTKDSLVYKTELSPAQIEAFREDFVKDMKRAAAAMHGVKISGVSL
jgi:hypothetical protein